MSSDLLFANLRKASYKLFMSPYRWRIVFLIGLFVIEIIGIYTIPIQSIISFFQGGTVMTIIAIIYNIRIYRKARHTFYNAKPYMQKMTGFL